jgi:hypothetical protein
MAMENVSQILRELLIRKEITHIRQYHYVADTHRLIAGQHHRVKEGHTSDDSRVFTVAVANIDA